MKTLKQYREERIAAAGRIEKRKRKVRDLNAISRAAGKTGKPLLIPIPDLKLALDNLASQIVRIIWKRKTGGACAFAAYRKCGGVIECCFHFVRKSRSLRLRYDLRNMVGSCIACNGYMENNEGPFWTWYALTFGVNQMATIQEDSHGTCYGSRTWLEAQRTSLKLVLESLMQPGAA